MFKIISILALLSLSSILQAAPMILLHPKLHQSSSDGGLISASVRGMTPNLTVKLYNLISGAEKKLIGVARVDSQGFAQFPTVFISNKDAEIWYGQVGHYVTLIAEDGIGDTALAGLRIN